jgi:hypothetical protein
MAMINEIIKMGADVKSNAKELLDTAVYFRRAEIIEFLLDSGADIQGCSRKNFKIIVYDAARPSAFAFSKKGVEILDLLLRRGASLEWIEPPYRAEAEKALAAYAKTKAAASAPGPLE